MNQAGGFVSTKGCRQLNRTQPEHRLQLANQYLGDFSLMPSVGPLTELIEMQDFLLAVLCVCKAGLDAPTSG
jgi:hypothetical protein